MCNHSFHAVMSVAERQAHHPEANSHTSQSWHDHRRKENPPQQDGEQEQTPDLPMEAVAHLYLYAGTHIYI